MALCRSSPAAVGRVDFLMYLNRYEAGEDVSPVWENGNRITRFKRDGERDAIG